MYSHNPYSSTWTRGQIVFRGAPTALMQAAEGKVWTVTTTKAHRPDSGLTVISMLHLAHGIQYRLVGPQPAEYPDAQPIPPGLEDGYVWLMQSMGQASLALV